MERWLGEADEVNADPSIHHSLFGDLSNIWFNTKDSCAGRYDDDRIARSLKVTIHVVLVE